MAKRTFSEGDGGGRKIADVLRQAIRAGVLAPGTALVQRDLAEILNVSRIPVRDALQTLSAEGLVTLTEGRARVTELSSEDIDELYNLRRLIEPALAEPIVNNHTRVDLRRLEHLVDLMDEQEPADEKGPWAQTNFAFHDRLYAAARRPMFHRIALQLLGLVESYSRTAVFHLGGWSQSQQEHRLMIQAVTERDAAELHRLLDVHLARAQRDLLDFTSEVARAQDQSVAVNFADFAATFPLHAEIRAS
jgi:DNA-binding GntR family transcriptional regulator